MFEKGNHYLTSVIHQLLEKESLTEEEQRILDKARESLESLSQERKDIGTLAAKIDNLSKNLKVSVIPLSQFNPHEDGYYVCFKSFVLKVEDKNFQIFPQLVQKQLNIEVKNGIPNVLLRG